MTTVAVLLALATPVVDSQPAPKGGYWELSADGGVFAHDGAPFLGSAWDYTRSPAVVIQPHGEGYRVFVEDGGVFAFGTTFLGSAFGIMPPHHKIVSVEFGEGYTLIDDAGNRYDCRGDCQLSGAPRTLEDPWLAQVPQWFEDMMPALAQCESNGNWHINTGNGYYGGVQFDADTWRRVGGHGLAHQASKAEQIFRSWLLYSRSGWAPWPTCTRLLGWR